MDERSTVASTWTRTDRPRATTPQTIPVESVAEAFATVIEGT
jgi:hypothetical protein